MMGKGWNLDNSYARLPETFYRNQNPSPVGSPELVILNEPLAISLGLDVSGLQSRAGVEVLAGNVIPEGALPIAQAYAGHQFGHFTMLGDGRAVLLGEQITPSGERFDIQLKGSGPTNFSRRGDGRGALGPMLREYIISEAMYALGIPTTRSLAVVTTGESVIRDTSLPGAVLTRVASSHLRIGTFQYARYLSNEEFSIFADYAIRRHFPDINTEDENRYLSLLKKVIKRQASLIAKWQLAGFIHGVMNTDNMTISGETIDYGPCAFMNEYDPDTVFSSIDVQGRYAYGNQPDIAAWNLARFAETLLPLLAVEQTQAIKLAEDALAEFADLYHTNWLSGMCGKLGIFSEEPGDEALIKDLLAMMKKYHADYTNTFLALTFDRPQDTVLSGTPEFAAWSERRNARLALQKSPAADVQKLMADSNPSVIPRNHRVEEALEAAVTNGDYSVMHKLLAVLSNPYAHTAEQAGYFAPPSKSDERYRTFCGT